MKCAVPLKLSLRRKKIAVHSGKMLREKQSTEANCRPVLGEKYDVYRAARTINAMEIFKVLPVSNEKFLVANKHRSCERIRTRNTCSPDLIGPRPILNCQRNRTLHIAFVHMTKFL